MTKAMLVWCLAWGALASYGVSGWKSLVVFAIAYLMGFTCREELLRISKRRRP